MKWLKKGGGQPLSGSFAVVCSLLVFSMQFLYFHSLVIQGGGGGSLFTLMLPSAGSIHHFSQFREPAPGSAQSTVLQLAAIKPGLLFTGCSFSASFLIFIKMSENVEAK